MTGFTGFFFPCHSCLFGFKADFGIRSALGFFADLNDLCFFLTVILHQRNIARADPGTGTAFNAVKQMVLFCFFVFITFTEPVELLRQ